MPDMVVNSEDRFSDDLALKWYISRQAKCTEKSKIHNAVRNNGQLE